ncbi:unnamed protein product [Didymodactylos carnosus]|uniref:Uncharacterized protein n=1 Tax=Didymodactylos carnosus TaxID=1234261 RepID=A0A814V390_9BILA|nr:unnamed protein product [Didymodactylos carnosus]CAF1380045.1 unnamed protein product [Didymodactylos carnosus]CAF3947053.1 unnamed protein product [Didymodactylos carnosus]CAF4188424.1 unnamed protein product [Didymodactylos carnosus]
MKWSLGVLIDKRSKVPLNHFANLASVKMRLPCTDFYPTDAKRVLVTLINSAKGKDLLLAYYISQDTNHQTENIMHNVFALKFGTIIKTSALNTIDFPDFHFPINRYPKHMALFELDRRSAFAQQAKAIIDDGWNKLAKVRHQKKNMLENVLILTANDNELE